MFSRLILLAVALVAFVALVPDLRERARPYVEGALDPVYQWTARNRVNEIHRSLARARSVGQPLPTPREFSRFLEREEGAAAAADPWGSPYYLWVHRAEYRVGSAGPDRVRGTADDILSEVRELPG